VHPWCASDAAILDAELTAGLPPRITAFTGMDALTHAVEGLTARTANVFTQGLALQAIRLIFANLPKAVAKGDDLGARQNMLMASTLAIAAYSFSPGGAVHALAHSLGGWFGVPHGLANSLLLPHVLEFNAETLGEKAALLAGAIDPKAAATPGEEAARFAVRRIRELQAEVGLPARIRDACAAGEADLARLVETAMGDMLMGLNPRRASPEDAAALYRAAL
ncbi:MAG: iron-containing alcohol dehydrogenase, partial [Candidatus Methylomirabilis sp.]|nr:iron-containing alcohol dehydrogenase [Deltaproteobacteria bacterium]